ncbi:MAG: cell wall-binding repeat-containing protein [Anaerovoracaceae bacterium]|nr:cell wall-binding repeat-containing protein [Anaerovoracaceae bacterium]
MKKILVVFFSLLLVFLMVPVLPNAVYADTPAANADVVKALAESNNLSLKLFTNVKKIPGASGEVLRGETKAPESITTNCFHDATLPNDGWIAIDADGDGNNWMYAYDFADVFYSIDGEDGQCMTSASYINDVGALTPDNWLVSPKITVPASTQLQFYVGGQDRKWAKEHYGVFISTTSQTDTSTFTMLKEGTCTLGGSGFNGVAVDLSEYAGQEVYLAIRHFKCTDMYFLNLDGMSLAAAGTPVPDIPIVPPDIYRLAGENRYDTSLEIAGYLLKRLSAAKYPFAIIATGDAFPDALAGSALSTMAGAPILLVSPKVPSTIDNAMAFIEKNVESDGIIFILGGEKAVPTTVEAAADELGVDVFRFDGSNRYETNLMVLSLMEQVYEQDGDRIGKILVCDGTNWPDAATASATGLPILLTAKTGFNEDQWSFINYLTDYDEETDTVGNPIYFDFIGGEAAVPAAVYESVADYELLSKSRRIAGANRAETAAEVAKAFNDYDPTMISFAYARNFPDCISGGLLAYVFDAPILYGDSVTPKPYMDADVPYIAKTYAWAAFVFGGEKLVSDEFINNVFLATLES